MNFSHSQKTPPAEDRAVYVEELNGTGDYWLSLTDAARICRVQDVSIRRAIARGVLPVRGQRAGQNKRTRFVRASDLAQAGFPIIDESAAISTEIGKVDVLSIPRQQQQIIQEHQALVRQLDETRETFRGYQEQLQTDLRNQQERLQTDLSMMREEHADLLAALEARISQEQTLLRHTLADASQRLATELQALRQILTQEQTYALARDKQVQTAMENLSQDLVQERTEALARDQHVQANIDTLQTALLDQQQEMRLQLADLVATQQKALTDYQQVSSAALRRVEQETQARFLLIEQQIADGLQQLAHTFGEQLADGLKQLTHTFDARLTDMAQALTQVQQTAESLHQDATAHDQELQQQRKQIEPLLPLLPYAGRHLLTEQDLAAWSQTLAELETRVQAEQQRELVGYRQLLPLLDLLTPERVEILLRLVADADVPTRQE